MKVEGFLRSEHSPEANSFLKQALQLLNSQARHDGEIQLCICTIDQFLPMHVKEQLGDISLILGKKSCRPSRHLVYFFPLYILESSAGLQCDSRKCIHLCSVSFLDLRMYKTLRSLKILIP